MKKYILPLLYPLSLLYRTIIALRNLFFDLGIFSQNRVEAIVISVGNLSVGGTGKTPLVLYLIDMLSTSNKKIAVVTRGYGRSSSSPKLFLPSDKISDWLESGDEPFLLKNRVKDLTISIDSNKFLGATEAVKKGNSDLIIIDDGFQHRSLIRDLDIVIISDSKNLDERLLIPAGRLREPVNSLKRADIVVFMGSETESREIKKQIKNEAVLCGGLKEPELLIKADTKEELSFSELKDKNITAFCGIGNPEGFRFTLNSFDPAQVDLLKFSDHHIYSQADFTEIKKKFLSSNSDFLITTEKDVLKLPSNFLTEIDVYILRIAFRLGWGKSDFDKKMDTILRSE